MSSYRDELKAVSEKERVALPEGFQINPDVLEAATQFWLEAPLAEAIYRICPLCRQGLWLLGDWRGAMAYTETEMDAMRAYLTVTGIALGLVAVWAALVPFVA